jgi:hypothetical protein
MSEFNNHNDTAFLMSGGDGLEQLIDDPILLKEFSSFKGLLDSLKIGGHKPPEQLLGTYILETATCSSIKSVMKQELTNKINKHYNDIKREDFEQHLKGKIQTFINENIQTQLTRQTVMHSNNTDYGRVDKELIASYSNNRSLFPLYPLPTTTAPVNTPSSNSDLGTK